jgi:hypothetical protein
VAAARDVAGASVPDIGAPRAPSARGATPGVRRPRRADAPHGGHPTDLSSRAALSWKIFW